MYLTTHAIARLLDVSPSAVLTWIDKGLVPAFRTPGGHRRVERTALVQFLRSHGMPVPHQLLGVTRLLVIDDEPAFLRATRRQLARQAPHLGVEAAAGAVEGLLKVGTFRPDAVLLDAYMPGMDGLEMCRKLRGTPETAHILVIALTGRPSREIETQFLRAGAAACLVKPLEPAAFLPLLERARTTRRVAR